MANSVDSGLPQRGFYFRDPALPLEQRVDSLLRCLTLDEKLAMLRPQSPAVPSLGVAASHACTEALHGVGGLGTATVFPQTIGLAATWNPDLLRAVGRAVSAEVQAFHRASPTISRAVWAPVVSLLRDPRGRWNEHGYSEDPVLTSALVVAYCDGLRGTGSRPLATAPMLKWFLKPDCDGRDPRNAAPVRPRVFWEYEVRPLQAAVQAGVASGVLLSYPYTNDRPVQVGQWLGSLRDVAPDLVVATDALESVDLVDSATSPDHPRALAAALRAGVDSFTDDSANPAPTAAALLAALNTGLLREADIDAAVRRLLRMRFELGEFDRTQNNGPTIEELHQGDEHKALARQAARQAVVLLKNAAVDSAPLLPLRDDVKRLAVVGPLANEVHTDRYSGALPYRRTIVDAARDRWPGCGITFVDGADQVALLLQGHGYLVSSDSDGGGPPRLDVTTDHDHAHLFERLDWGNGVSSLRPASCSPGHVVRETFELHPHEDALLLWNVAMHSYLTEPDSAGLLRFSADTPAMAARLTAEVRRDGVSVAVSAATEADLVLVAVGNRPHVNAGEGEERPSNRLPGRQDELVRSVLAHQQRTVVLIMSSHPFAVPWIAEQAPALLWSCHSGQAAGQAVVDVLSGDCSPAGRLPQAWYRHEADLPVHVDHDIIKSRQTYLYSKATPLFPFGHGLGYTTFEYSSLRTVHTGDTIDLLCVVVNTGDRSADEVVQLYVRAVDASVRRPNRELKGFRRVHVDAGSAKEVTFTLRHADLAIWDPGHRRYVVPPGEYDLLLGSSSADIRLTERINIPGPVLPLRRLDTHLVRAVDFDDYNATRLVIDTPLGGEAVEAEQSEGWLMFLSCEFPAGATAAVARVAGDGWIQIRLAEPAGGPVAAEFTVSSDGQWQTLCVPASVTAGRHDVYLLLSKGVRISAFTLTEEA